MSIRKRFCEFSRMMQEVIVPSLKYSQSLYEDILKLHVKPDIRWLDLGCREHILPPWRLEEEKKLTENCKMVAGIDCNLQSLLNHKTISRLIQGDIANLPLKDNSFDLATANMVAEHMENPDVTFREIQRILRPGGTFIFHTPNISGYTAILLMLVPRVLKPKLVRFFHRDREGDFVTYYKANSADKIHNLANAAGFKVVKVKYLASSAVFTIIPPLALFEIIWIRITMTRLFKPFRTNIIAVLQKQ